MNTVQNGKGDKRRPKFIDECEWDGRFGHAFKRRRQNDDVMKHRRKSEYDKEQGD